MGQTTMRTRSGSHLKLRGQVYYYRRVVPSDLRTAFGCSEVYVSLDTTSLTEAERLEKPHDVEFERRLRDARASSDPDALARRIAKATSLDISLSSRWGGVPAELIDDDKLWAMSLANEHLAPRFRLVRELADILATLTGDQIARCRDGILSVVRHQVENAAGEASLPPVVDGMHTIEWAYGRWLRKKSGVRVKESVDAARRHLDQFVGFTNLVMLDQVRRKHIQDWHDALEDSGKYRPNSVNQRVQLVGAILRAGWRDADIPEQNLKGIISAVPDDNDRGTWDRDEILKTLTNLEPGSWSAWIYLIGLTTGVRLSEPMAAKVDWFDPKVGVVDINDRRYTKGKKLHCMPLIECMREGLIRRTTNRDRDEFLFPEAPRSANSDLPLGHEASKWFGRFFTKHGIDRVFHETRDTWIEAAKHSPVEKDVWEIISGHSAATMSDRYGGKKPDVLVAANETVCRFLTGDPEIMTAITRLVA